jgi:two-component system OmpR family sensor kinase
VRVLADPEQLRQVLANLTRNAVIHTPPQTGIEIRVAREGEQALLEVRDHGPGLPADAGERLFERFWRTEGGRSRGRGGAGLGLAIVKAIVETHHGQIDAYNAAGGGAVFRIRLPTMQGESGTEAGSKPGGESMRAGKHA